MYGSANTPLKIPIARGNESDQICKEKAEDNGFGSIRSMRKIEDRPRPRPESGRTATIPQANRERSVRAEDTIEVIDQAPPPPFSPPFHFIFSLNACHRLHELCCMLDTRCVRTMRRIKGRRDVRGSRIGNARSRRRGRGSRR